jgi:tetratricopeptide (TPR) repeat protein
VTSIAYTQAMLVGYEAAEQRDYQTALINFRRALEVRPGDYYALAAIANMEDYIAQQRREVARRQRIDQLQVTLGEAVQARDWACTAATVDELITLVPSNSLERTRLVTYRSEVTVFLDSRSDVEQWSTICPG